MSQLNEDQPRVGKGEGMLFKCTVVQNADVTFDKCDNMMTRQWVKEELEIFHSSGQQSNLQPLNQWSHVLNIELQELLVSQIILIRYFLLKMSCLYCMFDNVSFHLTLHKKG